MENVLAVGEPVLLVFPARHDMTGGSLVLVAVVQALRLCMQERVV